MPTVNRNAWRRELYRLIVAAVHAGRVDDAWRLLHVLRRQS